MAVIQEVEEHSLDPKSLAKLGRECEKQKGTVILVALKERRSAIPMNCGAQCFDSQQH